MVPKPQPSGLVVIKYGGSLLEDASHQAAFLADVAARSRHGAWVLVHGGGKEITKELETSKLPTRFVEGRRVTDDDAMAVVDRVLERINGRIVATLRTHGVEARGFSGKTDGLMTANLVPHLGRVGHPWKVDGRALQGLLAETRLPVFYPVGLGPDGRPVNINADDFAMALAIAVGAGRLVFLTDTGGILDKAGKPLAKLGPSDVERYIADGTITGGMAVKARACVEALQKGVGQVDICKGLDGQAGTTFVS